MSVYFQLKVDVLKEIAFKLDSQDLLTDTLKLFLFEEMFGITDTKHNDKQKENKKENQKRKRLPTLHQQRISKCMKLIKNKFPNVKHQFCLGASHCMIAYLKQKNGLDFRDDKIVEESITIAAKEFNDKRKEKIFAIEESDSEYESSLSSESSDEEEDDDDNTDLVSVHSDASDY